MSADDLYFITMLCAYSGARLNEIVQLAKKDIFTTGSIIYISINDNGTKTVKTKNSIRLVPLHSKLIELGLMDHINSNCKDDNDRIFKCSNKDFSEIFRKQINRKMTDDPQKTFYSFRHYVCNYLIQAKQQIAHIAALVGHEQAFKITIGTYSTGMGIDILKDLVEVIKYE